MDRKRYEELCEEAGALNTCEFIDGKCERGTDGCCHGCKHLDLSDETGACQVNSLLCKLWVCDERREGMDMATRIRLQEIWDEARGTGALVARDEPEYASDYRVGVDTPDGHYGTVCLSNRTD